MVLVCPPESPEALAEALTTLITAPATRQTMGAKGREIVLRAFDHHHTIDELVALFDQSLEGQLETSKTTRTPFDNAA